MNSLKVPIRGMHCASCEILIGKELKKIPGVASVNVNHKSAIAEVAYEDKKPTNEQITKAVQTAGYDVGEKEKLPWFSKNVSDYMDLLRAAAILFILYLIANWLNLFSLNISAPSTGVAVALLVGVVAGVSTCMALVGGLVLSLSARHAELHPEATARQKFRPHLYFNLGRIVGFAALGGLIGLIGQVFKPSVGLLGFLTIVVGAVMIFFGLKLIEIFPVLKDKSITLPTGIARFLGIHKDVREYSPKSSIVMGVLTFFLPCGFTQAMQLYAVSTGSFWQGAAVMGLFAVGTSFGLLGIGGLTSVFKGRKARIFFMIAGLAVIILGWTNITNGSRLLDGKSAPSIGGSNTAITGEEQIVRMTQSGSGYSPNILTIEKGRPVKWIINSTSQFSCASSLVVPKYDISQSLKLGDNVITFTPTESGEIPFSCSMGMYRGKFVVVDSGSAQNSDSAPVAANPPAGSIGSCANGGGGCGGCGGGRRNIQPQVGTVETAPNTSEQVLKSVYTYSTDMMPNTFTVKKGRSVRLEIDVKENGQGCMSTVVIPGLYDQVYRLVAGQKIIMTFTPYTTGSFPITCAMGVVRGVINVVE